MCHNSNKYQILKPCLLISLYRHLNAIHVASYVSLYTYRPYIYIYFYKGMDKLANITKCSIGSIIPLSICLLYSQLAISLSGDWKHFIWITRKHPLRGWWERIAVWEFLSQNLRNACTNEQKLCYSGCRLDGWRLGQWISSTCATSTHHRPPLL